MGRLREQLIGGLLAERVRAEMASAAEEDGNRQYPIVHVTGFHREAASFVESMAGFRLSNAPEEVRIVVAEPTDERIPSAYRLPANRSVTSFRNDNRAGLVFVNAEHQGDAQGLRNVFTLTDRTLLERRDDAVSGLVRSSLLRRAWAGYGGDLTILSSTLEGLLTEVFVACFVRGDASLRTWVDYVETVCEALAPARGAASATQIGLVVAEKLAELGLFPDPALMDNTTAEARARRLHKNRLMAGGRSPSGAEIPEDRLLRRIEDTVFLSRQGDPLKGAELETLRSAARALVDPVGQRQLASLTLDQWSQVFAPAVGPAGLGSRVRDALSVLGTTQVADFDALDVERALDEQDPDAAELLLKTPGREGRRPISDDLPAALRRQVERVSTARGPGRPDPLLAILEVLHEARSTREGLTDSEVLTLRVRAVRDERSASLDLFRFLYVPVIREVVARSIGGGGWVLELPGEQWETLTLAWHRAQDDEDWEVETFWGTVRVEILAHANTTNESVLGSFEWSPLDNPGLIAFARVVSEAATAGPSYSHPTGLDDWCGAAAELQPLGSLPVQEAGPTSGPLRRWLAARVDFARDASRHGLRPDAVRRYVETWQQLLSDALADWLPRGCPSAELRAFLEVDTLRAPTTERLCVLASHPIRLRWIAAHFGVLAKALDRALAGGLRLNETNDAAYFDRMRSASPHQQPPVICSGDGILALATREFGWHEEYAAVRRETGRARDWLSSIDDASVEAMVSVLRSYLDAYPHKMDGLGVLVLSRDGDTRMIERIVAGVRRGEYSTAVLDLHVFAPVRRHADVATALSRFDSEEERSASVLPSVRTILHPWEDPDTTPNVDQLRGTIDVALVPNLFGAFAEAHDATRPDAPGRSGRFDPWYDPATHIVSSSRSGNTENVSKVLLPREPDPCLERWSTANVWAFRGGPVSPDGGPGTDYVRIQLRFDRNRDFFLGLHDVAHWVVTLDPFVGREQVESLRNPPDVITVRPGVGKNGTYTLVVTSSAGRTFIVSRLARRIEQDVGASLGAPALVVADKLYGAARHLAPGVLLRALGLGRTVQEILGLLVGRRALEEARSLAAEVSFEAWIPLDEHTDWFGGPQTPRADLLRLIASRVDGRMKLRCHVLECKFRERENPSEAVEQVTRTVSLLRGALTPDVGATGSDDAGVWRRLVLAAIEQGCKRPDGADAYAALNVRGGSRALREIPEADRVDIKAGQFDLEEISGFVCTIAYGIQSEGHARETVLPTGQTWLPVRRPDLPRLIGAIVNQIEGGDRASAGTPAVSAPVLPPSRPAQFAPSHGSQAPRVLQVAEGPGPSLSVSPSASPKAALLGIGEQELESRYQRVIDRLHEFGIRVDVPPKHFSEGPGFYVLRVTPSRGVSSDAIRAKTDEIKLALRLPHALSIRSYIDEGAVLFEVPKVDPERFRVDALDMWGRTDWPQGRLYAPIGQDVAGRLVGLDLSSTDTPHLLIAGTTGSGKSVALDTILRGLCWRNPADRLSLVLVDPKGTEMIAFERGGHVRGQIGTSPDDAKHALDGAVEEMQRRYDLFRSVGVNMIERYNAAGRTPLPWWVVVLDEYADLTSDPDDRRDIEEKLARLAQKARASGIHVIVATQKPTAEVISTTIRSNLPARLALRVSSATDSRVVLDESGAECLSGKGDALLKSAAGTVRLQCAHFLVPPEPSAS